MVTISPNMNLPVPVPSKDPGPNWAQNVDACLSIVDGHSHSPGQGVPVTPAGMNISTDLSFGGNSATLLKSLDLVSSSIALSNLISAYAVGTDGNLYWNDALGNQIQITQSGGVAGTPGSIANLVSPASATFVSGTSTFVWKSTASLSANMDMASIVLRYPGSYPSPTGNYILIQAPSTLASGYAITMPAVPASSSFVTISSTGDLAASVATANGITRANLAAVGQQVSASSGTFSTASSTFVDILNQTVTITTSGRPVQYFLQSDGSANATAFVGSPGDVWVARVLRDAVEVGTFYMQPTASMPASVVLGLDTPTGGTYTYKVQIKVTSGGGVACQYMKLVAYEL